MGLEHLMYTPLMEENTVKGWNKQTVDYSVENEKLIRGKIGQTNSINSSDIDDIYNEILLYFYEVDDYNINKAARTSKDGKESILPIEGYVFKSIEFCIKRYITNKYNRESLLVNTEVRTSDDNLLDLLDTIADNKSDIDFENTLVDLNQHCKECESMRYSYGIDIFQVWYVRLLVINKELDSYCFDAMMSILGISKRDLKALSVDAYKDEIMLEFARGINKHGIQESIDILEEYVYSAEQIKKAIESLVVLEVA